ncbi:MAG: hypothetical protein ABI353_21605 [Isosphaeraceae bacterium]
MNKWHKNCFTDHNWSIRANFDIMSFGNKLLIEVFPETKLIRQGHLTHNSGGFLSDMRVILWQSQEAPGFAEPDCLLAELAKGRGNTA